LRRLGRVEESVAHYRRVVVDDPRNVSARLGEVLALVRLGRLDEALTRIEEAHLVVADDRNVRHVLVRLLATAPDPERRDGPRALELARALVAEERSANHVVALAMAAAAAGDLAVALEYQRGAIGALERAGRTERLVKLRADLERYERGEPCVVPWGEDDPLLNPRPLTASRGS
jgi:tetratricopeptide (TPR) repeat protein